MSFVSIGDLSSSYRLRYLNSQLKGQSQRLSLELATGKTADISARTKGGLDRIADLERSLKMTGQYERNNSELKAKGDFLQMSLENIQTLTATTAATAATAASSRSAASIKSGSETALQALNSTIGSLNQQVAGQSLFAGNRAIGPAMAGADKILGDLETLTLAATTADEIRAIVTDYFDSAGGGFETGVYLGSTKPTGPVSISDTESASYGITGADTGIRETLKHLATAALLGRGILGGDLLARVNLMESAASGLFGATDAITDIRATIGATEARIETVATVNGARKTSFQMMLNDAVSVDGYETATGLQAVENQLEALYLSTSRLSQLSLTRYLR
ncbi:MAG: hypothetical protein KDA67_12775 [Rhodobacteraceae bacterium]|nr:hypothetical protein [Paracoccaceae bacterium]